MFLIISLREMNWSGEKLEEALDRLRTFGLKEKSEQSQANELAQNIRTYLQVSALDN